MKYVPFGSGRQSASGLTIRHVEGAILFLLCAIPRRGLGTYLAIINYIINGTRMCLNAGNPLRLVLLTPFPPPCLFSHGSVIVLINRLQADRSASNSEMKWAGDSLTDYYFYRLLIEYLVIGIKIRNGHAICLGKITIFPKTLPLL